MIDYAKMQIEHREWVERIYPRQKPLYPALVIVEELGELAHTVLKHMQREEYGDEERYEGVSWYAKMTDAVGDVVISCCSLCNALSIDFAYTMLDARTATIAQRHSAVDSLRDAVGYASCLMKLIADPQSVVNVQVCIAALIAHVYNTANKYGISVSEAVDTTWTIVKERKR